MINYLSFETNPEVLAQFVKEWQAVKDNYSMFQLVCNIIQWHNSRSNKDDLILKEASERLLFGILY